MPSLEESKRQVREGLKSYTEEVDHDAILASMQDEIDRHMNNADHDTRRHDHKRRHRDRSTDADRSKSSTKFRFKEGVSAPKRKRRRRDNSSKHERQATESEDDIAHPLPRKSADSEPLSAKDSTAAFRESLFDALADDEGAAYWESVYNQPIHVYPRPSVETPQGKLEQMNDDQYAAYVQTKMWEKNHPHIVQERERTERRRREEEEEDTRRRAEYVRRKERAAWERAQAKGAKRHTRADDDAEYEYVFDFEGRTKGASKRSQQDGTSDDFRQAWAKYYAAWENIKIGSSSDGDRHLSKEATLKDRLPWPVLTSRPVTKPNIETFFRHIPVTEDRSKLQLLKAERVRWHPDKIQHRFGGDVDESTMKMVTSIFQTVDEMVEEERRHESSNR